MITEVLDFLNMIPPQKKNQPENTNSMEFDSQKQ